MKIGVFLLCSLTNLPIHHMPCILGNLNSEENLEQQNREEIFVY